MSRVMAPRSRVPVFRPCSTGFCVSVAALIVLLQLVCYEYDVFFRLRAVPSHDLYQGASFFATSMHSVRLSGDIAWWNPIRNNGYAQYYQSFLSPLVPTTGNIVFIVWRQGIQALSVLGIALPEYTQYLVVVYVVLPFLMYLSFALFLRALLRSRWAILLVMVVYGFSGIALWNTAWFFAQEPFTLFFLLAAMLALLQRPNWKNLLWLLAAALIQVASINYWTIYNSWFIVIVLGAYALAYPNQVRRLLVRLREGVQRNPGLASGLAVGAAAVCGVWLYLLISVYACAPSFLRPTVGDSYTQLDAYQRVQEMRRFTTELFNPCIGFALQHATLNPMHNARYIGAGLLPLLALVPFYRWRRLERFLLLCALGVFVVCIAPPFLLWAWQWTPGMSKIQHVFYFYSHYWQMVVALFAGAAMDQLLTGRFTAASRRTFKLVQSGVLAVAALIFVGLTVAAARFPTGDPGLQANLRLAVLVSLTALVLLQTIASPSLRVRWGLIGGLVLLVVSDLGNYFWEVSLRDRDFSTQRWGRENPLSAKTQAALSRAWRLPDAKRAGIEAGIYENMPVTNDVWPVNLYLVSSGWDAFARDQNVARALRQDAIVEFFDRVEVVPTLAEASRMLAQAPSRFEHVLVLQSKPPAGSPPSAARTVPASGAPSPALASRTPAVAARPEFSYEWKQWEYNALGFVIHAPKDGWLLINQLPDPDWQITVDGARRPLWKANFVAMALPVKGGRHDVVLSYRPLARTLYPVACGSLELGLLALLLASARRRRNEVAVVAKTAESARRVFDTAA